MDMSEPPDWIPRPPSEEEMAQRQQERQEQEERAVQEREVAEAAAETERVERGRQEAEAAAEAERVERERQEIEADREQQRQLQQLAARLEGAPERRRKLAMHFGVDQGDVATWEATLDVILDQLKLADLLRHPELIGLFEAMELGLAPDGVYRLAFATNLKQQVLVRPSSAEVVGAIVIAALGHAGTDASDVRPVIPQRLDWERHLDPEVSDGQQ